MSANNPLAEMIKAACREAIREASDIDERPRVTVKEASLALALSRRGIYNRAEHKRARRSASRAPRNDPSERDGRIEAHPIGIRTRARAADAQRKEVLARLYIKEQKSHVFS